MEGATPTELTVTMLTASCDTCLYCADTPATPNFNDGGGHSDDGDWTAVVKVTTAMGIPRCFTNSDSISFIFPKRLGLHARNTEQEHSQRAQPKNNASDHTS